jgi:hypothetical protein
VTPTDSELRDFLAVGALRVGDYFCFEAHAFWTFFGLRDPGFSDEDPDARRAGSSAVHSPAEGWPPN